MSRKKLKADRERTDREKLELFLERARELAETDAAKEGLPTHYSMKWSAEDPRLQITFTQPEEGTVRSFILELRKFISPDSDIFLNRIHGIIYKNLKFDEHKEDLVKANSQWRHSFTQGWIRFVLNEEHISPERAWLTWTNGRYFHDDQMYREELKRLDGLAEIHHRMQFLAAVQETATYLNWLARNTDYFLTQDMLNL